jgi:hypothetical protein
MWTFFRYFSITDFSFHSIWVEAHAFYDFNSFVFVETCLKAKNTAYLHEYLIYSGKLLHGMSYAHHVGQVGS